MNFSRTLIIKPSSMGDIVQALPVLTALKEKRPGARVWWLVGKPFAGLLEGHPRLEGVIAFDRERFGRIAQSVSTAILFMRFLKDLRRRRFTAVLDLQGLFRSGLLALATGAPDRVGLRSARELAALFYTVEVPVPASPGRSPAVPGRSPDREMHAVDRYMALAKHVGLDMPKSSDHLPVAAEARARARHALEAAGLEPGAPYLVVCAHARWQTKLWPRDRFVRVIDEVHRRVGARAVIIGDRAAAASAGQMVRASSSAPLDLAGRTTLKELVAVIAEARVMVANDSGPMHIAAAVGTPTVAIFGPTSPARTGPYGPGHRVVAGRAVCSPCYRRECPLGGSEAVRCLKNVSVEEVVELVIDRWRAAAKPHC